MRRELGIGVALILLCFGLWLSNPEFLGHSNLVNTLRQISMLGIFAIGISGLVIDGFLRAIERRAVPWRGKV